MNLILLSPEELRPDGTARLADRRAAHAREVLRAGAGDRLTVGVLGGRIGTGLVQPSGPGELILEVSLDRDPPARAPADLLLALPRPKVLRRILQAVASVGVARVVLVGSWRVEKSYFSSPLLDPDALREQLWLGLEQGRDTLAPEVMVRRRFKPFVEDELDALFPPPASQRLLAHPASARSLGEIAPRGARALVAIGPEGGWTRYEADRLEQLGFAAFTLGERPLRVDTAVAFALGQVALAWGAGAR